MNQPNLIKNKNVLVTGATGGVGKFLCKQFIDKGSRVYAIGRNNKKLLKLKEELGLIHTYSYDFSNLEDIDSLNTKIYKDSGGIDIIINSAGVFNTLKIEDINILEYNKMFNVNLLAPILITKFHIENMKRNQWGRIFNIGSSSAYNGCELTSLYCASKHALLGFSRSISKELHSSKIRVCNLSPSSIKTDMGKIPLSTYQDYNTFLSPEEVSEIVIFICSFNSTMEIKELLLNRVDIQ